MQLRVPLLNVYEQERRNDAQLPEVMILKAQITEGKMILEYRATRCVEENINRSFQGFSCRPFSGTARWDHAEDWQGRFEIDS